MNLRVPREELPPEESFTIKAIVRDLELIDRDWAADLQAGYFCQLRLLGSVEGRHDSSRPPSRPRSAPLHPTEV